MSRTRPRAGIVYADVSARVGRLLGGVSGAVHSTRQRKEVMRKLKLQMQVTVDGYVAGPEGQLDWMTFDMDAGLLAFITHLTATSDTILLGGR